MHTVFLKTPQRTHSVPCGNILFMTSVCHLSVCQFSSKQTKRWNKFREAPSPSPPDFGLNTGSGWRMNPSGSSVTVWSINAGRRPRWNREKRGEFYRSLCCRLHFHPPGRRGCSPEGRRHPSAGVRRAEKRLRHSAVLHSLIHFFYSLTAEWQNTQTIAHVKRLQFCRLPSRNVTYRANASLWGVVVQCERCHSSHLSLISCALPPSAVTGVHI